jgi:hypothetical protein
MECKVHDVEVIGQGQSNPPGEVFDLYRCVNCKKTFRENPKKKVKAKAPEKIYSFPRKPKTRPPGRFKRGPSKTQSVIFTKAKWTLAKAVEWLEKHGFKNTIPDETKTELRFRQLPTKGKGTKGRTWASIPFGWETGIRAVIFSPNPPEAPKKKV